MNKLAALVCVMVLGSILVGCAQIQPQRLYDTNQVVYKDAR
jgi:hypothetical protein